MHRQKLVAKIVQIHIHDYREVFRAQCFDLEFVTIRIKNYKYKILFRKELVQNEQ